jgi:AAA15 family ATPase/GTPase
MDCSRVNVLVGGPNTGKSNILEALSLLGACYSQEKDRFLSDFIRYEKLSNLFYDQNRKQPIQVKADSLTSFLRFLQESNIYDITLGESDFLSPKLNIDELKTLLDELYYQKKEGEPVYYTEISVEGKPQFLEDIQLCNSPFKKYDFQHSEDLSDPFRLFLKPPHGRNLVSVLDNIPEVGKAIPPIFEDFGLELLIDPQDLKLEILKRVNGYAYKVPYSLTADTIQRIFFYFAAIHSNQNSVLLFEELESHAFPPYASMIAEEILDATQNQFFLTTHNPYILTTLLQNPGHEDVSIFIVDYENYETKVKKLTTEEINEIYDNDVDLIANLNAYMND